MAAAPMVDSQEHLGPLQNQNSQDSPRSTSPQQPNLTMIVTLYLYFTSRITERVLDFK